MFLLCDWGSTMLINRSPDVYEKVQILGAMASDDILSARGQGAAARVPYASPGKNPIPGVYRASMPNGKRINLMRVMFTDFCKMDCAFCPNSHWVPRKRYSFKVDELADTFMELQRRHTVAGLFLSSGVAGSGSKTTERLVKVVDLIRRKHGFKGYIHLKVMPGTEFQYVEAAHRLSARLSVNIETPTTEHMRKLSAMKDLERDILSPMEWIDGLNRDGTGGAVGQATQLVVGAADESDWDIFRRMDQLYADWNLKRIYFAAFRPVRHTPLEEHPPTPPAREHRLYQIDWLKRVYHFSNQELELAFDDGGFLPLETDPKTAIAAGNLDAFPVEVNTASSERLLRVPGVGPTSAERILENRGRHSVDNWKDLQAMGVIRKRAWPFLVFPGHRPPSARQLRLDLFGEQSPAEDRRDGRSDGGGRSPAGGRRVPAPVQTRGAAPCGQAMSCGSCPMYGMPGHPGG